MAFYARGSTREVDAWLANPRPFAPDDPGVLNLKLAWLHERGDYAAAVQLESKRPAPKPAKLLNWWWETHVILDLLGTDDRTAARLRAETLLPEIDAVVAKIREQAVRDPYDWHPFFSDALVHALTGDTVTALRVAREILEIRAKRSDAWQDAYARYDYVKILALAGEKDQALTELARLLRVPYGPKVFSVRHDPAWRSFQGDPRFEALLSDPKNNAPRF